MPLSASGRRANAVDPTKLSPADIERFREQVNSLRRSFVEEQMIKPASERDTKALAE